MFGTQNFEHFAFLIFLVYLSILNIFIKQFDSIFPFLEHSNFLA